MPEAWSVTGEDNGKWFVFKNKQGEWAKALNKRKNELDAISCFQREGEKIRVSVEACEPPMYWQ